MDCIQAYRKIYHSEPEAVSFCPYRICPIGAHIDHQYGKIIGFAIDKGVKIAYKPKQNGVVELASLNFSKRAQFHVQNVPVSKQNDWADYLRGAALALNRRHPIEIGISGVIEGQLPIGGLSSSAAVIISFLTALSSANNLQLTDSELVELTLLAENEYVGVNVGKLDPFSEVYSKKDNILYLDVKDDSYELIPTNPKMKKYQILIIFSGIERTLVGSMYNIRVDESKSTAHALKAYAIERGHADISSINYGKLSDSRLRDVPRTFYDLYKELLPGIWRKRAEHFYSEYERVEKGVEAWKRGDLDAFGKLSFQSGHSSIYNYETGSDELKAIYEIMLRTDGIYGGRFSGAGFKGCCVALIDPAFSDLIKSKVMKEYIRLFPQYSEKVSFHLCQSVDGVGGG